MAIAVRFEGFGNPETGEFDVWTVSPEEWELGVLEDDGVFRRTGQALNDYCIAVESLGIANSVRIQTVTGTIFKDNDCPSCLNGSCDGFGGVPLVPYTGANGAYCATVRITSNYLFPLEHLYAEIRNVTDGFEMYSYAVQQAIGLGNGTLPPETVGNNTPSDTYGLVGYPNLLARGDAAEDWWIFQRPGDTDFFFSGFVVFSPTEVDNDVDDDCDGYIDEDTQSYLDGEDCRTDLDCVGGTCDCAGFPCGDGEIAVCRTPYCGDTFVEGAEDCDHGLEPPADTAFCDFDCSFAVCGDDYVNPAANEDCDPGLIGGFTAECNNDCSFSVCHDGILNTVAGEICDDGNITQTDGCVNECVPAFCGDGLVRSSDVGPGDPGYEQCDDANTDPTDNCIDCVLPVCGDGWVHAGVEECDGDGLGTGGETALCNGDCTFALCGDGIYNATAGETCDEGIADTPTDTPTCDADCSDPSCGDAYVNTTYAPPFGRSLPEQCDAGSGVNNDQGACTSDCQFAYCGDGFHRVDITDTLDPEYEACDNGPLNSDTTPDACRTNCVTPYCGDNVIDPSGAEICDNGPLNSDIEPGACRTDCAWFNCGDGVRDPEYIPDPGIPGDVYRPEEECDAGDADHGAGNSNTLPDTCRTNCTAPTCGDGVRDINGYSDPTPNFFWLRGWDAEPCDDGDLNNNNDCLNGCVVPTCGDGYVWNQGTGGENCDDGDTTSGDGCSSICIRESGWSCPTPGQPCVPICGDGLLRGTEECDDGNTNGGDGCNNNCTAVETGWYCTRPNTETADTCVTNCGDGIRAGIEQCDTVNDTSTCDAGDCTISVCGDNYLNTVSGEVCDDGNLVWTDGCLGDCSGTASCGDGYVQAGVEQCDDAGNSDACDGPAATSTGNDCTYATCGDGYINTSNNSLNDATPKQPVGLIQPGFEVCDNGGSNSDTLADTGSGVVCRSNCQPAQCGDGVRDTAGASGYEQCDSGTLNSNTVANRCRSACLNPFCGDGVIDSNAWDVGGAAIPNSYRCDGAAGISGSQTCQNCIIDQDGDGYVSTTYGGADCDDSNPAINPAAVESTNFLDTVDSNCDGYNFSVVDPTIWIVHSSCLGVPASISTRCRTSIQAAINGASAGHNILVRAPNATTSPIVMRSGRSVYGGWNHSLGWLFHSNLTSARSPLHYVGLSGAQYHVAVQGHDLREATGAGHRTVLAYMAIRTQRPSSTSTDATTMHGISVGQSSGFDLHHNTITVDGGLPGVATNHGRIEYPGGSQADCLRPGFQCSPSWNGGQGNGWQLWCPAGHQSYFYRGNSAMSAGGAGGSSIGVLYGQSYGATISNNTIITGAGGVGATLSGRGAQGGNSVSVWFHDQTAVGWSVAGANGNPVDCGSAPAGNTISLGGYGNGGAGTYWAAGRRGFRAICHYQNNIFEWFRNCSQVANTNTVSSATVTGIASNTTHQTRCSP